jgi:Tol biopolymer transport system component
MLNRMLKNGEKVIFLSLIMMVLTLPGMHIQFGKPVQSYVEGDGEVNHRETNNLPAMGYTERVSVASDGAQGNGTSGFRPTISADGRYVAFASLANNLVSGDTNGEYDIFVHDRNTRTTVRISVASDGTQANWPSTEPAISADGRYVAFSSEASNLVIQDTAPGTDVFLHDRYTGNTELISVASDGTPGNKKSYRPSISADGRYIAFGSEANNLISEDVNDSMDVFVYDQITKQTLLVSVASDGSQGNGKSFWPSTLTNGRYIAFSSFASNLVMGDTNNAIDIFVHDLSSGQTERVSVGNNGEQGNGSCYEPSISADGRYVAFASYANNLVSGDTTDIMDIFVHDRATKQTVRVSMAFDGSEGNNNSYWPSISADGRYVAFESQASNLVSGDTNRKYDIFLYDRFTSQIECISIANDGSQTNGSSLHPSISADGRVVAFRSEARNLVNGDSNGRRDAFVRERLDAMNFLSLITNQR